jgi:hypothetical protein
MIGLVVISVMICAGAGKNANQAARDRQATSQVGSSALPAAAGPTSAPAADSGFIPGLTAADVHLNFSKRGFKYDGMTTGATGKEHWMCKDATPQYSFEVEATGTQVNRIELVNATALNLSVADTDALCGPFLQFVATLPYDGADPDRAKQWVAENLGKNAELVIGGAKLVIFGSDRSRSLQFVPAGSR